MKAQNKPVNRTERSQGMNWISQKKRLAIYLRDGLACCYCGSTVEEGAKFTLDHLTCHKDGGTNEATNLVTSCLKCNTSRGTRPVATLIKATAAYLNHGTTASGIQKHITNCRKRVLDVKYAQSLIALRGSCFNVVNNLSK